MSAFATSITRLETVLESSKAPGATDSQAGQLEILHDIQVQLRLAPPDDIKASQAKLESALTTALLQAREHGFSFNSTESFDPSICVLFIFVCCLFGRVRLCPLPCPRLALIVGVNIPYFRLQLLQYAISSRHVSVLRTRAELARACTPWSGCCSLG